MEFEKEITESVKYLLSSEALQSIKADAYWPKWNSPWWHMLLLHEMGQAKLIPENLIQNYISSLNQIPLKIFPILPADLPPGTNPQRDSPCHCQIGNVYQVLSAWGVDVDTELTWIRPWLLRYQMADGGLNCDSSAYLIKDETPSSIVGTIAAFEAILLYTDRTWTAEEEIFLAKGAAFLIGRKLIQGSQTEFNASERQSAEKWAQLCFPRFYFYDVLRGLTALLKWSEKTGKNLPADSIFEVVTDLKQRFPDGQVRIGRQAYDGIKTIFKSQTGEWNDERIPATHFPLLDAVSQVGSLSPFLARQWEEAIKIIG